MESADYNWWPSAFEGIGFNYIGEAPPNFDCIPENLFVSRRKKKFRSSESYVCLCSVASPGKRGCDDETCLNRLSMIECMVKTCPCGDQCANQRFRRHEFAKTVVIRTEKKGWGLLAASDIKQGQFIIEYCGEVINYHEFQRRARRHHADSNRHFYFMSIGSDDVCPDRGRRR
jgi:histone-lysine N-methyltransferase SETD2